MGRRGRPKRTPQDASQAFCSTPAWVRAMTSSPSPSGKTVRLTMHSHRVSKRRWAPKVMRGSAQDTPGSPHDRSWSSRLSFPGPPEKERAAFGRLSTAQNPRPVLQRSLDSERRKAVARKTVLVSGTSREARRARSVRPRDGRCRQSARAARDARRLEGRRGRPPVDAGRAADRLFSAQRARSHRGMESRAAPPPGVRRAAPRARPQALPTRSPPGGHRRRGSSAARGIGSGRARDRVEWRRASPRRHGRAHAPQEARAPPGAEGARVRSRRRHLHELTGPVAAARERALDQR